MKSALFLAFLCLAGGAVAQSSTASQTITPTFADTRDWFPQIDDPIIRQIQRHEQGAPTGRKSWDPLSNLQAGGMGNYRHDVASTRFPGIDATGWVPADCTLACGPGALVMTVNDRIAFYDKSTGGQISNQSLNTFFASNSPASTLFDPKCFYDAINNRFFVVALEVNASTSFFNLAVSDDNNPVGTWAFYHIDNKHTFTSSCWLDYEGFGGTSNALALSGNMFPFAGGNGQGVEIMVMPKAPLLSASAVTVNQKFMSNSDPDLWAYSIQWCTTPDAALTKCIGVATLGGPGSTANQVQVWTITNPASATPTYTQQLVSVPSFTRAGGADARTSGGNTLDPLDGRIMNCDYRGGKIVAVHAISTSNPIKNRWYEFNYNTGTDVCTLDQSGTVSHATDDVHMGGIIKNGAGTIGMVFTQSNTNKTADIMFTSRASGDAAGTMGTPTQMHNGGTTASYTSNRWGDYAGMCVDPSDDATFWMATMSIDSDNAWHCYFFKAQINPVLTDLSLSAASVEGGTNVTGTVTLNTNAPVGGTVVSLSSNNGAASVPANTTVAASTSTKNFTITTSSVISTQNCTITATLSAVNKTAPLAVTPVCVPATFVINPGTMAGGGIATATVTTNINAPAGGAVINISESAPQLVCPATVTVAAGTNSATFPVTTTYTASTITRSVNVSKSSTTLTANITLTKILMSTFSLSPVNLYGGLNSTATITLTAPAPPGFSIKITDDKPYVYTPTSVAFVEGATSATFTITTKPTPTPYTCNVTATKSTQVWVRPLNLLAPALTSLTVSTTSIVGGGIFTATVNLLGTAVYGGTAVNLSSSGPEMVPPATAVVPYNGSSKTVSVHTTAVAAQVVRVLTAELNGVTRTKSVAIKH